MIDLLKELSPREQEVTKLVAEGLSNRRIASRMFIVERTVEHHLASIYDKLRSIGLLNGIHHPRTKLAFEYFKAKKAAVVARKLEPKINKAIQKILNEEAKESSKEGVNWK